MIKKLSILLVLLSVSFNPIKAAEKDIPQLANHVREISVTVSVNNGEHTGTGVLFTRPDSTRSNNIHLIWTAGHVVESIRKESFYITDDGTVRKKISFGDVKVSQTFIENGRIVEEIVLPAEVIQYSDKSKGSDLAILRIKKQGYTTNTVTFYDGKTIPPIGTTVYHAGCFADEFANFSSGMISGIGKPVQDVKSTFDTSTTTVYPGSSGGGIFLNDGRCIGIVVRMFAPSANYFVPIRDIKEWVHNNHVEWAIDPNVPIPTNDQLKVSPIERGVIVPDQNVEIRLITTKTNNPPTPKKFQGIRR